MERLTTKAQANCGFVWRIKTPRYSMQDAIDHLAAYEDTDLEPNEITTEPYGCVFYCNRKCNLDGDFCAEGPGCPHELMAEDAMHLLEISQAEKDGRLVVMPPNDPLTLEELREMDGEPIFVVFKGMNVNPSWYIVNTKCEEAANKNGGFVPMVYYGHTWLAFRRKPEEVTE